MPRFARFAWLGGPGAQQTRAAYRGFWIRSILAGGPSPEQLISNPSHTPTAAEISALAGHQFPGGFYTIAHWENFLLTECTGAEPLPDGLAHAVALFHMPILGAGTSIGEMFALGQAESDFSIGIESYDWEIFQPLREDVRYAVTAHITEADRRHEGGRTFDRIQFRFDLADPAGEPAARTTVTWHYHRRRAAPEELS